MNLATILRETIKPELNRLYTESPTDGDWGWFCREHAYHCYFLCRMLGFSVVIKQGDFLARKPFVPGDRWEGVSSFGQEGGHAWCQVEHIVPVDISVNFEFFCGEFPWVDLVYGTEQVDKYSVYYTMDEETHKKQDVDESSLPRLMYLERETIALSENDLQECPFSFLRKPRKNGLGELFGNDIFHKLTMHLYDLATHKTVRLTKARKPKAVLEAVRDRYVNATEEIRTIIELNHKSEIDL